MKKKHYTLYIKEIRFKESIANILASFYNPAALIILITITKNPTNNELLLISKTSNSVSKYITFIEKNNERVLKKISIDYFFSELPENSFESFFFLVEINFTELTDLEITQQFKQIELILHSVLLQSLSDELLVHSIDTSLKRIGYSCIRLLKVIIPVSDRSLNITASNDFVSLEATIEPLL